MLDQDLKDDIQTAYRRLVEAKSLRPRWGQKVMIAEIANALSRISHPEEGEPHIAIEAGTGTGKTIAYAIAAIPVAQRLAKKLVVATATVALQEQFVFKDLPDIRKHSGLEFSFALAKGRRRYVCLSKLDKILQDHEGGVPLPLYPDEVTAPTQAEAVPMYRDMLSGLAAGTWDGDRDNWDRELQENLWFGVTTDHAQCTGRRCANISQCAFFKSRDRLHDADVIVANHDLVLADLGLGGGAILPAPEDTIYVFDEGHHLPDKALNHFSAFCRLGTTQAWLEDSQELWRSCGNALQEQAELTRQLERMGPIAADLVQQIQLVNDYVDPLLKERDPE
ncbi:MAG: ATP-dependent DNA helicase DinG, partial [Halieaceae bacterium]